MMSVLTHEPGEYRVFVHDKPDAVRTETTDVTVHISLDGALVYSELLATNGEDTDTAVARVNAAMGAVTPE